MASSRNNNPVVDLDLSFVEALLRDLLKEVRGLSSGLECAGLRGELVQPLSVESINNISDELDEIRFIFSEHMPSLSENVETIKKLLFSARHDSSEHDELLRVLSEIKCSLDGFAEGVKN